MISKFQLAAALSLPAMALTSCAVAESGDSAQAATGDAAFTTQEIAQFEQPWAIEFAPGTDLLFITEKAGAIKVLDTTSGKKAEVSGAPQVAFGGQGGLGDIVFLDAQSGDTLDGRTVYLSWAEMGDNDTRGAAVGRGSLTCDAELACAITDLQVIWRQSPKVEGRGHFSHRIAPSPDGQYLFIASGERQKQEPAQDLSNTLGTVLRLNLDGSPAADNPFADRGGVSEQIWSYGHRNVLGLAWDAEGRLWDVEHGPAGGDELNLVQRAANYGWPTRSYGNHYNGDPIPDHSADDGFTKPAVHWTPVIAPGDMIFYSGDMFPEWQGDALISGLSSQALVRVELDGEQAAEAARYDVGGRARSVEEGADGSIWLATDEGAVLRLSRK